MHMTPADRRESARDLAQTNQRAAARRRKCARRDA